VHESEPSVRPLGFLALGLAILSLLFAVSYFFSPLAYLAAALAIPLGLIARSDEKIRAVGTVAATIAVGAIIVATLFLVLM